MRTALMLLPLALVAAAGPQRDRPLDPAVQAKLDKRLAGYTPGASISCVPIGNSQLSSTAYGPVLVYQQSGGPLYVNNTGGGCEGAARGDILVTVQYEGRACSGDIIRTVDQSTRMPTGSCALRDFTLYTKAK